MLLLVLFAQMQAVHRPDEIFVLHFFLSLCLKHYPMLLGNQTDALLKFKKNLQRRHLTFGPFVAIQCEVNLRAKFERMGEKFHGEVGFLRAERISIGEQEPIFRKHLKRVSNNDSQIAPKMIWKDSLQISSG